jgi:cytochrome b involved in lipid metabolism
MNSLFDTIGGLPLHPLAVHAASVLIPLSALALVLLVFVPKWRKAYLPLTVGALAVSVLLAFAAKESGEALAARVGNPGEHAELGDLLFPASIGLFILGATFYFFTKSNKPKWTLQLAGGLSTAAVAGVVILTVLVGHSGAQATWGNRIAASQGQDIPAPVTPVPGATSDAGIGVAEVQKHNTANDCWTVVKSNVYDLTSYIARHPGGSSVLTSICGKDGTQAFTGQHAGAQRPNAELTSLLVGPLSAASASSGSSGSSGTTKTPLATTFTAAEVAKHNSGSDCWSVVSGQVYDLTSYVTSHPGGATVIKAICGKDGSAAFTGQHGSASRPNNTLAAFALGSLVTGGSLPQATVRGGEEGEEGDDD